MKAKVLTAAFITSILLAIPALLLDLLFAINAINPFTSLFVSDFRVRNDSAEPVEIWVAGSSGKHLRLLPLYASGIPGLPEPQPDGLRLEPGNAITLTYDWDDINFTLILVKAPNGEYLALPVDTDTSHTECCFRNEHDLYVIPTLTELRHASAEEQEAILQHESKQGWILLRALLATCVVLPFVPVYLWHLRRRLRTGKLAASDERLQFQ